MLGLGDEAGMIVSDLESTSIIHRAMQGEQRARTIFLWLWTLVTAAKLIVAARLPLFVDEAFYWQEGQHLAAAYSDLPGLTAWLARLGVEIGGHHVLALRLPFLAIGAAAVVRTATRWFGNVAGWQAGSLTLLMPLSATLGLLAVPDVPMALAAVICLPARACCTTWMPPAMKLALGLLIGALSHYRFIGVIGVGFIALLALPQGGACWPIRAGRVGVALAAATAVECGQPRCRAEIPGGRASSLGLRMGRAVVPGDPADAGDADPVHGDVEGGAGRNPERRARAVRAISPGGGVSTLGIFVLGFTDVERSVSTGRCRVPGMAVPVVLNGWPLAAPHRLVAGAGMVAFGYYLMASTRALREQVAGSKYYPRNFAGWQPWR